VLSQRFNQQMALVARVLKAWRDHAGEATATEVYPPDDWANERLREYDAPFTIHFLERGNYELTYKPGYTP
jgi:hypothetical protein